MHGSPPVQWVPRDPDDFLFPDRATLTPADYLIGLSTPQRCAEVVRKLATDPRMRPVWTRLQRREDRVRASKPHTFLTNRPGEYVACAIARRCVTSLHASSDGKPLTRRAWSRQHQQIAATADRLRSLLTEEGLTHPDLRELLTLFSTEMLRVFAGQIYFHVGPHSYEPLEVVDLSQDREPPVQTPEEIEAEDLEWDRGVKNLQYWLEDSIRRAAPKLTDLLSRLEQLARKVSRNPPAVGPTSRVARQVAALSDALSSYFRWAFGAPLDETVATIVDVLTDSGITADAIKVRRHRLLKHRARQQR